MRFPYREYISIFPGTTDYRLILRPVITMRVKGPKADARWDALLDTGADETLFPVSLADILGIELDRRHTSEAVGVSGDRLRIHYGNVEIQIELDQQTVTWQTPVGFVDFGSAVDEVIILGHGGCLDYFTATFDGEQAEFELVPNSLLPNENITGPSR